MKRIILVQPCKSNEQEDTCHHRRLETNSHRHFTQIKPKEIHS